MSRLATAFRRRAVRAASAVVAAVVLVLVGALLAGWSPFTRSVDVLTYGDGGDMRRFALFEGQCARGDLGRTQGFGPDDDAGCATPHDLEVVAARSPLEQSRSEAYPGRGALAEYGRSYCRLVLGSDVVAAGEDASGVGVGDLTWTAVIPSEAAYLAPRTADASSAGARQVACVLSRSGGEPLTERFSGY